jgi:hypothetical protein
MSAVRFPVAEFGAVIALYSMIHLPLAEQRPLLRRIRTWLEPDGWFLAILGHGAYEGWDRGWLGSNADMFWSHADAASYRRWLTSDGFEVVKQEFLPEGDGGHELFLVKSLRQGRH